jgi:hypothetical protein
MCRCVQKTIDRLYFPVANFDNPTFFGLVCMAQSAPSATGLETKANLDLEFRNGATVEDLLISQGPLPGTRLETLGQLWANFVQSWVAGVEFKNSPVKGGGIACAALSPCFGWLARLCCAAIVAGIACADVPEGLGCRCCCTAVVHLLVQCACLAKAAYVCCCTVSMCCKARHFDSRSAL